MRIVSDDTEIQASRDAARIRWVEDKDMSTILGTNNLPKGPVTILGQAYVGETLIARPNGIGDADGIDYSTETFQWLRDGEIIEGATGRTFSVSDADVGARISVRYSYVDFGGTLEILTSDPEKAVPPAGTTLPDDSGPYNPLIILGDAIVGESLTARPNAVSDAVGINTATIAYQWFRDGTPIPGATSQSYAVTEADIDAQITVQFSYLDLRGTAKSLTSNPKDPVPVPVIDEVIPDLPTDNAQDDLLFGTAGADTLRAAFGLKRIDAFGDTDTVSFGGDQTDYTVVIRQTGVTVSDHRAFGQGAITLENVEFLDFAAEIPAFDGPFDLRQYSGLVGLSEDDAEAIIELYIAYFNRAPDAIGLNFWGTAFANGVSLNEMALLFADQNETRATYPDGTSSSDFATEVYANVLGRMPDQAGLTFWTNALESGAVSRDELILQVLDGARSSLKIERGHDFIQQQIADRNYLENKIDIGALYAVHKGMSDVSQAEAVMALYDGSSSSIIESVNAIDAYYRDAIDPNDGAFLLQVVGVLDNPFLD